MLKFLPLLLIPLFFLDSCNSQNIDFPNLILDNGFSTMEDNLLGVEDNFLTSENDLWGVENNFLPLEDNLLIASKEDQDNEVSDPPKAVSEPGTVVGLFAVTVLGLSIKLIFNFSKAP
ncbi:hypothetical protein cce_3814 [Crocosphaera subtropica ATCC 51142]|uniref:Uncharacterized protein n=1 Tax=Crocosphaera subtropica (strain ATCC 51142 / BH68) TaxID=43989 RepID=B1WNY3_CROS5|nr:hypothetical protein [Crocosphaera subtropica]ACB53162.1 hypothetical protein cce_3814 [Crocosphaera subtropica ATCC 51142]